MSGDLEHRNWLLFSTKQILETIDINLSIEIIDTEDGGMRLIVSNISEETIDKLKFLTNNDKNNNYFYFEEIHIYLDGSDKPTIIPGFNEVVKDMFERSDINGFIQDKKLHEPFNVVNLPNAPGFTGKSFNEYLDTYSGLVPECVSTKHHTKYI